MKNDYLIKINLDERRFNRRIGREKKKKITRRKKHEAYLKSINYYVEHKKTYAELLDELLPPNISYLINCEEACFYLERLKKSNEAYNGNYIVPKVFSLVDNPKETYRFIKSLTYGLIYQKHKIIYIDYINCENIELGAQVLLDIIIKDIIEFYNKLKKVRPELYKLKRITGSNISNDKIAKLLFSVGSPAIHANSKIHFEDIIPYSLCIHNRDEHKDPVKDSEQKDIDTTKLVDYVLDCLHRLNRSLTSDRLDDLSTVIGETLINAEEHSTTQNRFSIGYFQEFNGKGEHYGLFRLVILNFGKTIYQKFKDPECPNKHVVEKMNKLSKEYTKRKLFFFKEFDEETLWTLYALQEGVTSVAPERYRKRGNGSIQFIEKFFNIKGKMTKDDNISKLTILSGNTNITFDGSYNITRRMISDEEYRCMTFNKSGKIEDKPDTRFVKFVDDYFPGTVICAKILFNENDFAEE